MSNKSDRQPLDEPHTSPGTEDEDGVLIPGSAPPLSPGRADVNPDDQAGVDELADSGLKSPRDRSNDTMGERGVPDIDVDKAEMDDAPNPR